MHELPPWLDPTRATLEGLMARGQFPHAVLIHGPSGCGRRMLALWVVRRALGLDSTDLSPGLAPGRLLDPEAMPQHPDFTLAQLLPDKRDIPVDRIRELIDFLSLTSHQGGTKVALITPAETLNKHAANCLLKTLEEPPGPCLIVLVTDALSRLPATLVSRCHRLRVNVPAGHLAVSWLEGLDAGVNWPAVLELTGGAPISALELQRAGFPKQAAAFEQDVQALRNRAATPGEVAGRWARTDPDLCLRWLYLRIGREIREVNRNSDADFERNSGNASLKTGSRGLSLERSFGYLGEINELRRLQGSGLKLDLQLAGLLTRWYGQAGS
jgi:DNA polymerase-3 subunit delta'